MRSATFTGGQLVARQLISNILAASAQPPTVPAGPRRRATRPTCRCWECFRNDRTDHQITTNTIESQLP